MTTASPTVAVERGRPALRPYQSEDADQISDAFRLVDRVLYQLDTGAGKTEVAVEVLDRHFLAHHACHVVWLTHRLELREQTQPRIEAADVGVIDLTTVAPKRRRLLLGGVSVVTPGMRSVEALIAQATEDDLLIVDEAHHSVANSWDNKFITPWPGKVLGLTATPWRMAKKEGFDHLYQKLICGPPMPELIEHDYLSPFTITSPVATVIKGAGRDASGDYSPAETEAANSPVFYSDLPIRVWQDKAAHSKRTIWYTPTLKSAQALTRNLRGLGYKAALVHAKTPLETRRDITARFNTGDVEHLVNVAIVTEGADFRDADCVVILRPTKSLVLYRQMVGRALRPRPGKHAMILDLGRSWMEKDVGHPADQYPWSLLPRGDATTGGTGPVRWCQDCEVVNPASARNCMACGVPFGQECEGCGRFRFYRHWQDPDTDVLCDSCRVGLVVDHIITRDEVPADWAPNEANDVLRHKSDNCVVMRSRFNQRVWVVGYRTDPRRRHMDWAVGYVTFQEAWDAAQIYVESGFTEAPTPPLQPEFEDHIEPGVPMGWGWNGEDTVLWHSSRRCHVMVPRAGSETFLLGYRVRDGSWDMQWLMGYPSVADAALAGELYLADAEMAHPPAASDEHEVGVAWQLSLAGYGVMPNRYGPGWLYRYPAPGDGPKNMVYVSGFGTEADALAAALEHLKGPVSKSG